MRRIFCLVVPLILLVCDVSAEPCLHYQAELHRDWSLSIANGARAVAIGGDYIYTVNNYNITAVDIADEMNPQVVSSASLEGDGRAVVLKDNFAFIASRHYIEIFDVADPAEMVRVHSLACDTEHLALEGDRLYVAAGAAGLLIHRINGDGSLAQLGAYVSADPAVDNVAVRCNVAYIDDNNSLVKLDVADPSSPVFGGRVDYDLYVDGQIMDLCVEGSYGYVLLAHSLRVLNVGGAGAPLAEGSVGLSPYCWELSVRNGFACVAHGFGVDVLDITDPQAPAAVKSFNGYGECLGLDVTSQHAYFGSLTASVGLSSLTTGAVFVAEWAGQTSFTGSCSWLEVSGDLAMITTDSDGLAAFDVSDPALPALIAQYPAYACAGVAFHGGYAYLSDCGYRELSVIDLSALPVLSTLNTIQLDARPGHMHVDAARDLLFAATETGLEICDISSPDQPEVIGSWAGSGATSDFVCVAGETAYVLDEDYWVHILDVADPSSVSIINDAAIQLLSSSNFVVADGFLYAPGNSNRFEIWDVGAPASPVRVYAHDQVGAFRMDLLGDTAYLATNSGLAVYDVANPLAAEQLGEPYTERLFHVHVEGDHVYAAGIETLFVGQAQCQWPLAVDDAPLPPNGLRLASHPNPFNPTTAITFDLAEPGTVELAIYDVAGRRLRTLEAGMRRAGPRSVVWDGRADNGDELPSGVYFARAETATAVGCAKLMLLK